RAFGFLENELLETRQPCLITQQEGQQFPGLFCAERSEPELGVVRLLPPLMAVLRAVIDEQQEGRGGDTLAQGIEEALRLSVDPVQVLKDENQGLLEAFA